MKAMSIRNNCYTELGRENTTLKKDSGDDFCSSAKQLDKKPEFKLNSNESCPLISDDTQKPTKSSLRDVILEQQSLNLRSIETQQTNDDNILG